MGDTPLYRQSGIRFKMHYYAISDLLEVVRNWGYPQLEVYPHFPREKRVCIPDSHLLQTHTHTHTHHSDN